MRHKLLASLTAFVLIATSSLSGQQPPAPQAPPKSTGLLFKSGLNLVLVDVVVRDSKTNQIIKGLTKDDFVILEDGQKQDIRSFAYEEIATKTGPVLTAGMLASMAGDKSAGIAVTVAAPPKPATPPPGAAAAAAAPAGKALDAEQSGPLTSDEIAGHRVMILLFDTSSMAPEDVQKAADSALKWVAEQMTTNDLVAVASIGSTLNILSDFKNDKDKIHDVLMKFSVTDGTATSAVDVDSSTMSTDELNATAASDTTTVDQSAQELDSFNNDVRLRGLKTLCENLSQIQQKKAILYFSAGMQRSGTDNQVELRAAVNACSRSNTTINPVDSRGLQAVVAGGSARQGSRGGQGAFSGRGVASQYSALASQQETLQALAADTGGTAFTDSNDFGEAFTKVTEDISAYYLIGYASANAARDGRFRRITVQLKGKATQNAKIDRTREGYYADRDFANTAKTDREVILQEQLMTSIPATDVPLFVTAGYFRMSIGKGNPAQAPGRGGQGPAQGRGGGPGGRGGPPQPGSQDTYYVPISLAVPGAAIPSSKDAITLDVRGTITDERRMPVGTIKDTLTVPPSSTPELAAKQVLYQTGVTLPPGRFNVKIVVRENSTGQMGTFETPINVPELRSQDVKVSSVVMSTQLQSAVGRKSVSPLIHDGIEIVPNLTHVFNKDQHLYFYYEVYDPTPEAGGGAPQLRTSLAFYHRGIKVFETKVVERRTVDVADRHAAVFEFDVPASAFKTGLYTCQVNIIDEVGGHFAFPRMEMAIR
jgi:VWFA-related protein